MIQGNVSADALVQLIRQAGRPVHINVLTRAALQAWLETGGERHYAPGADYQVGETVLLEGQRTVVKAVQPGHNPLQGFFSVVTLALPDGTERLMAAGISGAPAGERRPVSEAEVDEVLRSQGMAARQAVRAALSADPRCVSCQTLQGDLWCLAEMLPPVSQADLQRGLSALSQEQAGGEPVSWTTGQLVQAVWGMTDDGSNEYALHAFALSRALDACGEAVCLGDCWMPAQVWQAFITRPTLETPAQPTRVTIPAGVQAASEVEAAREQRQETVKVDEESVTPEPAGEDLETWRQNRPVHAVFVLHARHYYEGWLPLSGQVRRLFPPLTSGRQEVIFHHHFGDEPSSFRAWVDHRQGRIWISPEMYHVFRQHRIYPGARLRLSARNEREYDIATREPTRTGPIRVWRMWLDEDGTIQYEDHEEPRLYDVDENVYLADVRFEDLEALFRQAEEVGNSIFGLMYQKAVEWWEAAGRKELIVTADRLFEAIHFDERGRATSKATIAWELWRRSAFEPVGGGRYRFKPEFADRVRSVRAVAQHRHRRPEVSISECWGEVARLEGRELETLDWKRPFGVLEVNDSALRIQIAVSGKTHTIERDRIEAAWEYLAREGEIGLAELRQFTRSNLPYLAAILAALPGVTFELRPIRLTRRSPGAVTPHAAHAPERTRTDQLVATDLVSPGPLSESPAPPSCPPLRAQEPTISEHATPGSPVVPDSESASPHTPLAQGYQQSPEASRQERRRNLGWVLVIVGGLLLLAGGIVFLLFALAQFLGPNPSENIQGFVGALVLCPVPLLIAGLLSMLGGGICLLGKPEKAVLRPIEESPVHRISSTTPLQEQALLAAEARRLAETFIAGHAPLDRSAYTASPLASFVAARMAASPEQSDVVKDLLACLAGQMTEMHKEKQARLHAFRLDLAGYLDEKQLGKLNRLYTPKKPPMPNEKNYDRKLAIYEEALQLARAQLGPLAEETLELDDFWRLNQAQWMWLLRENLGDLPKMSGLLAVYEEHRAHLAPLMRRIARTNWLIDQVVRQLYGQSEEEIAIVGESR